MYTCICAYVYIYMHTYTYVCIYHKRALSSSMLTSALCGGEAPLAVICLFPCFVCAIPTKKRSGLARTACAGSSACPRGCVRKGVRAQVQLSMHGDVLAARYGLCRPFSGGECTTSNPFTPCVNSSYRPFHPTRIHMHQRGHMHFPVFIFQSNRQMPLSFSPSLRERVCGTGLGGKYVTVGSLYMCVMQLDFKA